jgi:hypothetical protein
MTQKSLRTIIPLLTLGLALFVALSQAQTTSTKPATTSKAVTPATAVQKDVPAEFKAAVAQMQSAKSSLEKAGDKWGGHRISAIHFIDQGLEATGQTRVTTPNEMSTGPKDEPAAYQKGISDLQSAKSDFEKSGNQWGGKREKAIASIDSALKELQAGIDYAKSHGTY